MIFNESKKKQKKERKKKNEKIKIFFIKLCNPLPSFQLLVSVFAQQSAFAVDVLSYLYAFHQSTGYSLQVLCTKHAFRSLSFILSFLCTSSALPLTSFWTDFANLKISACIHHFHMNAFTF